MARNQEKAASALYRWRETQMADMGLLRPRGRVPTNPMTVNSLAEAEMFRLKHLEEMAKKITKINDPSLTDEQIRAINDEINDMYSRKIRWDYRIIELGGPDFRRVGPRIVGVEWKETPGGRGYKYFGRALDLPGVREIFEKAIEPPEIVSKDELTKVIGPEYYGFRDEDDDRLLEAETKFESLNCKYQKDLDFMVPKDGKQKFLDIPRIPENDVFEKWFKEKQSELNMMS